MGSLLFLGTAGGRFATFLQTRSTGGIYYRGMCNIHIDPGPSAAHRLKEEGIDPTLTDAVLVSHCHPDHYSDAEVLLEAMTKGRLEKRGILIGSRSVVKGHRGIGPAISGFHQGIIEKVLLAEPGKRHTVRGLMIDSLPALHSDRTAVGFRFRDPDGLISYTGDTEFFPGLEKHLRKSRVLVVSNTRPKGRNIPYHMATDDAARLIDAVRPELAVLTHLGLKLIEGDPEGEAAWVERETGVKTVAARDGMHLTVGKRLTVK